jgi:hypothetical protein
MGAALMISEFAQRHIAREARGADHRAHIRRRSRIPRGSLLRGGQGRADELHHGRCAGTGSVRGHRQHGVPPVTDSGWVTDAVREEVAARRDRLALKRLVSAAPNRT